ncbi:hypothetical protein R1sor_001176 [Riccia sorocarpa]|uniref:Uncharacterized protein n=1 Tax=Riccia sorocarpa TaxID=122646 RepID=A0ABD3GZ67_9MARC
MDTIMRAFNFPITEDTPLDPTEIASQETLQQEPVPLVPYNPTMDEAIFRAVWRLQGVLDSHNCSVDLQNNILTALFGQHSKPSTVADEEIDYTSLCLGTLLRLAGKEWNGGAIGLSGLRSLEAIRKCYLAAGMPHVQRWRLCTGKGAPEFHEPLVHEPSSQDDYNGTGEKCKCSPRPTSGLQRDCDQCSERCTDEQCLLVRKKMMPFDHLPLGSMIKLICRSRSFCHEMLTMWRSRSRWMIGSEPSATAPLPTYPIKDWWDGTRAKELSWFWDPAVEYELPVVCNVCHQAYQAFPQKCLELASPSNFNLEENSYEFICVHCGTAICTQRKMAKGDPRNVPIMAHWDGFQSASTVLRSTWSVDVRILSAGLSSTIPAMPVLFIPDASDENTSKAEALNACLQPFTRELMDLFVNGVEVEYAYPSELIDISSHLPPKFTLRAILVLFTGDHPAQSMFGGFVQSGLSGCRRCKVKTQWHPTPGRGFGGMTVYGDNRLQYRFNVPRKTAQELHDAASELGRCETATQRKSISRNIGVTRYSVAWQFYNMYGFDPSLDLTYDAMHVLALSMFKKYAELLKSDAERSSSKKALFMTALSELTRKKPRQLSGRWPDDPFARLGFFKAEEYQKFVLYCVPFILSTVGYEKDSVIVQLGRLVYEIGRIFYLVGRSDNGWTTDTIARCRMLMASWRIRSEEELGATSSILDHVTEYNKVKTNSKNMESTFIQKFARSFFAECCEAIWRDDDGLLPCMRVQHTMKEFMIGGGEIEGFPQIDKAIVVVPSQLVAKTLSTQLFVDRREPSSTAGNHFERGIGIGTRNPRRRDVSRCQLFYLKRYWSAVSGGIGETRHDINLRLTNLKSVMVRGILYRPGDYVMVRSDPPDSPHWFYKARIVSIFYHIFEDQAEIFFEARWLYNAFVRTAETETVLMDEISDMQILRPQEKNAVGNNCRHVKSLECHFFPLRLGNSDIIAMEVSELRPRKGILENGRIGFPPPYPQAADVMLARHLTQCTIKDLEFCVINTILGLPSNDETTTAVGNALRGCRVRVK